MGQYVGKLLEFQQAPGRQRSLRLGCPAEAVPRPGQYVMAWQPGSSEPLGQVLFYQGPAPGGFMAAPAAFPDSWGLGVELQLRGPFGRGFNLPRVGKIAMASFDANPARLLGLVQPALQQKSAVALFTDVSVGLWAPSALEVNPLAALPESLGWADYLAVEIALNQLEHMPGWLGLSPGQLAPTGEAFVVSPMPCGGLAACGVCAVRTRPGWREACTTGPVFPLSQLLF